MSKRPVDPELLKRAFEQAAAIAAVVPEAMQEAAFHRALDQILGPTHVADPDTPRGRKLQTMRSERTTEDQQESTFEVVVRDMDRSAHPEVFQTSRHLDRALYILRAAESDFGVEWLTAPQIAQILTDRFRIRTSRQAITEAFRGAQQLVDDRAGDSAREYRIMTAGNQHLAEVEGGGDDAEKPRPARRRPQARRPARRVPAARKQTETSRVTEDSAKVAEPATSRSTRRAPGPKKLVSDLIDEGFLNTPRTIGDIQQRLRHKRGVNLKLTDLSPTLVRLLREGRLDRDQNEGGQYEYRRS